MFMVIVINIVIYREVRNGEKLAHEKHLKHHAKHGSVDDVLMGTTNGGKGKQTSVRINNGHRRRKTGNFASSFFGFSAFDLGTFDNESTNRLSVQMTLPEMVVDKLKTLMERKNGEEDKNDDNFTNRKASMGSVRSADIHHVLEVVEEYTSAARQYAATYRFGARIIINQCLAYTCAFILVWTFPSINRVVQHTTNQNYFPLLLLQCIVEPLQV
jgi:hypothetical protein